ncbi:MAG: hypothetical protein SVM80_07310 [Halobacteriota archaeon]|nr:hypothetical protein [Halobacteriota archaeon]
MRYFIKVEKIEDVNIKNLMAMAAKFLLMLAVICLPVTAVSTTVYISNASLNSGERAIVPIMIDTEMNIKGAHIILTYDPTVVHVTGIGNSDLNFETYKDINNTTGSTRYVIISTEDYLTGNIKFADVELKAVGDAGMTSSLDLDVKSLDIGNGQKPVPIKIDNASLTITEVVTIPWFWIITTIISIVTVSVFIMYIIARTREY